MYLVAQKVFNISSSKFKGGSRHSLSQGRSVTAARAWQEGIGRPGFGSRRPTGLRLELRNSVSVPPC